MFIDSVLSIMGYNKLEQRKSSEPCDKNSLYVASFLCLCQIHASLVYRQTWYKGVIVKSFVNELDVKNDIYVIYDERKN
jgi:hypothetical protein